MPGSDPTEVRLRWIAWLLALLIAASIWAFGIWARMTEDAQTVIDAFPFVVIGQIAAGIVVIGLMVIIRRRGAEDAS
jgi:hypothetical protein